MPFSTTPGVSSGTWYFEVDILPPETERVPPTPEPHTRIGIAQKFGKEINAYAKARDGEIDEERER